MNHAPAPCPCKRVLRYGDTCLLCGKIKRRSVRPRPRRWNYQDRREQGLGVERAQEPCQ